MCIEMVTGGTIRHGQRKDATARCRGKRGLHGMDSGSFEVVVFDLFDVFPGFSPATGSQRNVDFAGNALYFL